MCTGSLIIFSILAKPAERERKRGSLSLPLSKVLGELIIIEM